MVEYESIRATKNKKRFLIGSWDFKPEKINRLILGLVEKIKEYYAQGNRNIEYSINKEIGNNGVNEIKKAEIESTDGIIQGEIQYRQGYCELGAVIPGCIRAHFFFNSKDGADNQEYLGLVNVIHNLEKMK